MKHILFSGSLLLLSVAGFAQSMPIENWCGTAQRMNELKANPKVLEVFQMDEQIRAHEALHTSTQKGTIYKIPVVFHVLHSNGAENIDESQIFNALDVINRDFRLQNGDTAEVVPQFKPVMGDAEIEFVLATKDPVGNCFRGYTRTESVLTFDGSDGMAQVDAIRNGNDVYQGNWPSNKYLNVFVIADAGGAGGYTNYPSNWGGNDMSNGIWILHTQFGEIGTSSLSGGRSLTHECGHWLNLMHTWGNSNNPGLASNCNEDDQVADTPLCLGATGGCPVTSNGCGPVANVQNYMDYALSCQSMFTKGQVTRMRNAITSSVGGRNNLWTAQNLLETGADGNVYLCQADFEVDKKSICSGETVQFTDVSFNVVNGWSWSFPGGTPSTSTSQNPSVTYSTPGLYEVTLTATDGTTNDTEVKTAFIRVVPASNQLPFLETFESYSTLNNIDEWEVNNILGNTFELESTTGHTGTKCAKLMNFNQAAGSTDELVSMPVDLSNVSQLTLTFRYAYKRRNSNDDDWFRVLVTNDCGDNWTIRKTLHGVQLSSQTQSSSFIPSSQDNWTTVHMTNITSSYWVNNFRYKFTFEGGGGNNFYLDNINIYAASPSDELVAGLDDNYGVSELKLYPNPADDELNIAYNSLTQSSMEFHVIDLMGNVIQTNQILSNIGSNVIVVDTKEYASGVYFIRLKNNGMSNTLPFIVK